MRQGTAATLIIPSNATGPFGIGTAVSVIAASTGPITIQAGDPAVCVVQSAGANPTGPILRTRFSTATLIKNDTDTWYVVGDII
jgi:hypothetical protein